ncbi:MAG: M24 family metallopeptidase [Nitrososphaerales archaeon]
MLQDLDAAMEAKGVDALIALGDSTFNNPELLYLVGCSIPRGGIYVKRRGQAPFLVVGETDLGSARLGRVRCVKSFGELGYYSLLAKDAKSAYIELIASVLGEVGVEGKVAIYGRHKANVILQVTSALQQRGLIVIQEDSPTLLEEVMMTKDDKEVEGIRLVGEAACSVIREIIEQLKSCKHEGNKLLYRSQELTVGRVKRLLKTLLVEHNLKAVEEPIFAPAPGSYDPHYTGLDSDPIVIGRPIVFDLFPQGGEGYYFDVTRTISIGTPDREFKRMYDDVFEAQQVAFDRLRSGMPAKEAMNIACEVFEKKGYSTPRTNHTPKQGFTHSLGHGVGLTIGERPYLSLYSQDIIVDRQVFTVEPGLYDAKLGGVRLEDVVVMEGGVARNITPLEKILIY